MIYIKESGKTIGIERVVSVKTTNIESALRRIYELLKEAESVTDESEGWEVKGAFSKFHESLGAANNMLTLGILEPAEYRTLSFRQRLVGERLTRLNEKRALGTANT